MSATYTNEHVPDILKCVKQNKDETIIWDNNTSGTPLAVLYIVLYIVLYNYDSYNAIFHFTYHFWCYLFHRSAVSLAVLFRRCLIGR